MATRKKLLSDSEIQSGMNKSYRRESIADYITSRRGSLSDLVFSSNRMLSRDSLARISRNPSVSNQDLPPGLLRDTKQRCYSLVASSSLQNSHSSIRESRLEYRSNSNVVSGNCINKPFPKTKSLSSIQNLVDKNKTFSNKRRRWLRKIQSLKVFDSVLKGRQTRKRFDVSKKNNFYITTQYTTKTIQVQCRSSFIYHIAFRYM